MQEERVINETNLMRFAAWTTPRVSNKTYLGDKILDIKDDYKILKMMLVDLGSLLRKTEGPDSRLWKIACACGVGVYQTILEERELEPASQRSQIEENQNRYNRMVSRNYRFYDLGEPQSYDSYIPEEPVDVWAVLQELLELADPSDPLQTGWLLCILQSAGEIFCRNGENPQWKRPLDYLIVHLQEVLAQRQAYIPVPGDPEETKARRNRLQQMVTAAAGKTEQL